MSERERAYAVDCRRYLGEYSYLDLRCGLALVRLVWGVGGPP